MIIKSPLRYPGGKSRAVKEIYKYIEPIGTKTLCSPFFGGGSLEIFCAQKGIKVYGYDNFKPLVNFWQWLLKDPEKIANEVKNFGFLKNKEQFYELQKEFRQLINKKERKFSFEIAVKFYIQNRTSYSGSK